MAHHVLHPHPDHPPVAVRGITVSLERSGEGLALTWRVDGADRVTWPATAEPERTDGLWRATCFELFLMLDDDERYVEFNFSPSGAWAAYAFDGYREGMGSLEQPHPPRVERVGDEVRATCDLSVLPPTGLRMALTAVIEEEGGHRSFWSLAHSPGAPDFHHAACFAERLPAPGRA